LIYYIAIILFGAQAFETPIGLLCSSRLSQFTYLVVLFVEVTFDHVSEWYAKQVYEIATRQRKTRSVGCYRDL